MSQSTCEVVLKMVLPTSEQRVTQRRFMIEVKLKKYEK